MCRINQVLQPTLSFSVVQLGPKFAIAKSKSLRQYEMHRSTIFLVNGDGDLSALVVKQDGTEDSKSPGKLTNLSAMAWKRNKIIQNNGVNIKAVIDERGPRADSNS